MRQMQRALHLAVVAAVVLLAGDVLRCAPDYFSYFNAFARPENNARLLSGSNLDWGQGLLALREYEQTHPNEAISLAYFGSVDPQLYGIRAHRLSEGERAGGTVVVGVTALSGEYLHDPDAYRWVLLYPRVAILDGSLYVFRVGEH